MQSQIDFLSSLFTLLSCQDKRSIDLMNITLSTLHYDRFVTNSRVLNKSGWFDNGVMLIN